MTIKEIIIEALHDPQNWEDGEVKWNWVDSDLWLHPESKKFSDDEKSEGLDSFPDSEVPVWGEFEPRVTHPLPQNRGREVNNIYLKLIKENT